MEKIALIVAGGSGERMNSDLPKQFLILNKLPVLMHTVNAFYRFDKQIEVRLVLPEKDRDIWESLCKEYKFKINHTVYLGGGTRFESVKNGLDGIKKSTLVAIHDGVRPLVSLNTITDCFEKAEQYGAAIPVYDLTESIRKVELNESYAVKRELYRMVQTPQVFQSDLLLDAYNVEYQEEFTDDASVVEKAGYKIYLANGNRENIKITLPLDLEIAEVIMKNIKD